MYTRVPPLVLCLAACWKLSGGPQPNSDETIEVTLCNITRQLSRFSGKRVRFHATVISDGLEHTVLVDRGCKLGIIPRIPDQFANKDDIRAFERSLDNGAPGTFDKTVTATFTGLFSLQSRKRVLEVEEVHDLKITPVAKAKH